MKELKRLKLSYVVEIKWNYNVKVNCREPKLTKTGKLAKNQTENVKLSKFFESIQNVIKCGFARDIETDVPKT